MKCSFCELRFGKKRKVQSIEGILCKKYADKLNIMLEDILTNTIEVIEFHLDVENRKREYKRLQYLEGCGYEVNWDYS